MYVKMRILKMNLECKLCQHIFKEECLAPKNGMCAFFIPAVMSLIVIRMHRFAFVDKQPDKLIVLTGIKDNKLILVLKKRAGLEMLTGGIVLYVCVNCP